MMGISNGLHRVDDIPLVLSRFLPLGAGSRPDFARAQAPCGLGHGRRGRQVRHAAVAERRGASLVEGLTGAVESGLAKLQRVFQGRPDGFPPGAAAISPGFLHCRALGSRLSLQICYCRTASTHHAHTLYPRRAVAKLHALHDASK